MITAGTAMPSFLRDSSRRTVSRRGSSAARVTATKRARAGSVEIRSIRAPGRRSAKASAAAAEQVVLPTPPLPPKKRIWRPAGAIASSQAPARD